MQIKTLVVLSVVAVLGVNSTAMARGGGGGGRGGGGWSHGGMSMHGNAHLGPHFRFVNRFNKKILFNRFNRNPFLFGGLGWGGDWGWGGYGDSGYGNTTVVAFPQATPEGVTGSTPATPCRWNSETFNVPSSEGGKRPVEVVSCR